MCIRCEHNIPGLFHNNGFQLLANAFGPGCVAMNENGDIGTKCQAYAGQLRQAEVGLP